MPHCSYLDDRDRLACIDTKCSCYTQAVAILKAAGRELRVGGNDPSPHRMDAAELGISFKVSDDARAEIEGIKP